MGKCKFRDLWLKQKDSDGHELSSWCAKQSECEAFCKLCTTVINIENKGVHSLLQHAGGTKHKKISRETLNPKQMVLCRPVATLHDEEQSCSSFTSIASDNLPNPNIKLGLVSLKDKGTTAELILTLKHICSNFSANSSSDWKQVLDAMFPGSVPLDFSLSPKTMRYLITDALGIYFHDQMLEDLGSTPYTISFDETTNIENKKELQITVRYWSETRTEVVSRHLETVFLGKADADTLYSEISSAINRANLSLNNLLMIGSDGPNVNKKVHRLFNEDLLTTRSKGLVNIGTCPIHTVHNAFLKAIETFGEDASTLVINIHNYFGNWPSRWEDFEAIQKELKLPEHKFIKHTTSRWLTFIDATKRLIEQWPAVLEYFLKLVPTKKVNDTIQRNSYRNVVELLRKPGMLAELHFAVSSAELFQEFTKTFQSDRPLVHILFSQLLSVVQKLASRICRSSALQNLCLFAWERENLFGQKHLVDLPSITMSVEIKKEVSLLDQKRKIIFQTSVRSHYIAGCTHIIEKALMPSLSLKKALGCLQKLERKMERSCRQIVTVAKALPLDIGEDRLLDEWKCLQVESEESDAVEIEKYWSHFFALKTSDGSPKYPIVTKVVKAALCLSHGNADIERRFSASKSILDDSPQMSLRTLNSILVVKDGMRQYKNKPFFVPITRKLILLAQNAHKHYQAHMEEQRRLKEKEERLKIEEEEKKKEMEQRMNEAETSKKKNSGLGMYS